MTQILAVSGLKDRIEQRTRETEELYRNELKRLSESLRGHVNAEFNTTKSDMEALKESLNSTMAEIETKNRMMAQKIKKTWAEPVVIGLSLFLGICAGSWGLMRFLTWRIESQIETLRDLEERVRKQRVTEGFLKSGTFGITLQELENGRFIVLPPGMSVEGDWTVGDKEALRLIKE